jgi:hypothetical protein
MNNLNRTLPDQPETKLSPGRLPAIGCQSWKAACGQKLTFGLALFFNRQP